MKRERESQALFFLTFLYVEQLRLYHSHEKFMKNLVFCVPTDPEHHVYCSSSWNAWSKYRNAKKKKIRIKRFFIWNFILAWTSNWNNSCLIMTNSLASLRMLHTQNEYFELHKEVTVDILLKPNENRHR